MQRRHHRLLDALEDVGRAGGEVIVEQDGAGVEIGQADAVALAHQRFQREPATRRQFQRGRLGDLGDQCADADDEAGLAQDVREEDKTDRVAAAAITTMISTITAIRPLFDFGWLFFITPPPLFMALLYLFRQKKSIGGVDVRAVCCEKADKFPAKTLQ